MSDDTLQRIAKIEIHVEHLLWWQRLIFACLVGIVLERLLNQ